MSIKRRIHVIKMPTTCKELFPYSHYNDYNHNPYIMAESIGDKLILTCEDLFKLKPNVINKKTNRIEIYMPKYSARQLGNDIMEYFGSGSVANENTINPEYYRVGQQTLPIIDDSKVIEYDKVIVDIAGFTVEGKNKAIYIDLEKPNKGHIEMVEQEVHLGIPLQIVKGRLDESLIISEVVPLSEIRVKGEANPVKKSRGIFTIEIRKEQARKLAATLIKFGSII